MSQNRNVHVFTEEYPLAKTLSLMGMAAEVVVEVSELPSPGSSGSAYRDAPGSRGFAVRFETTTARAAQITRSMHGTMLMLRDTFEGSTTVIRQGGQTIVNRGNVARSISVGSSSISISGGSTIGSISVNGKPISFDGAGEESEPLGKVVVTVPRGTAIVITDPVGKTVLGDIEGALTVASKGIGDVLAGKTRSLVGQLTGTGDIEVAELLDGICEVESTGTGDLEIDGGRTSNLSLRTSGTGSMHFRGVAERADLTSTGTGDIRVKQVIGAVRESNTGVGEIRVKRRGA